MQCLSPLVHISPVGSRHEWVKQRQLILALCVANMNGEHLQVRAVVSMVNNNKSYSIIQTPSLLNSDEMQVRAWFTSKLKNKIAWRRI